MTHENAVARAQQFIALPEDYLFSISREKFAADSPPGRAVRLVLASDTHEQHGALFVPDGDVFIHAGDVSYRGDLRAIGTFGKWLQALPHRHKIVIAGNHDWAFQIKPVSARRELGDGTHGIIIRISRIPA